MSDYVNLNEVGGLTRAGKGYDGTAQDNTAESRNFSSKMDASKQGLQGAAGRAFTGAADQHAGNVTLLANQIAQQALRAVRGEQTIVSSDEEALANQQSTVSAVDGETQAVSRPITF
jgi:uncharacterized protein YukE